MTALQIFNIVILFIPICAEIVCLRILDYHKPSYEQKFSTSVFFGIMIYDFGCVVSYIASEQEYLLFGMKIRLISGTILFFLVYSITCKIYHVNLGRIVKTIINTWTCSFLIMEGLIGIKIGNTVQRLFVRNFVMIPAEYSAGGMKLGCEYTVLRDILMITFLFYLLVDTLVFHIELLRVKKNERWNQKIFYICTVLPLYFLWADMFLDLYYSKPFGISFFPMISAGFSVAVVALVMNQKFNNLNDLANSMLIDTIADPVFIVDNKLNVHSVNIAARALFPEYENVELGTERAKAVEILRDIIVPPLHPEKVDPAMRIGSNYFEPRLSRVKRNNRLYGYLIILNDVTEERRSFNRLENCNQLLSINSRHNVERIIAMREKFVSGVMQSIGEKDSFTADHLRRCANYTQVIAKQLVEDGKYINVLSPDYVNLLCQVAPLHDVAKLALPSEVVILDDVTGMESDAYKDHVVMGSKLIDRFITESDDDEYYTLAHEVVECHHERWDGNGFPGRLKGGEIPLSARIVALVDYFDCMSASRTEKSMEKFDAAVYKIVSNGGTMFDPIVVDAFYHCVDKLKGLYEQNFQYDLSY